jgi:hypothetical protein
MKAQSEVWKAQVTDHQERLEQTNEKARENRKKAVEQVGAKAEEAQKDGRARARRRRSDWKDMFAAPEGVRRASERLGRRNQPVPVVERPFWSITEPCT